jgi:hypothetical protein
LLVHLWGVAAKWSPIYLRSYYSFPASKAAEGSISLSRLTARRLTQRLRDASRRGQLQPTRAAIFRGGQGRLIPSSIIVLLYLFGLR